MNKRLWTGVIRYPHLPVFYCADLHLDHANILLYCGRKEFMSASEREMYDAWVEDGQSRRLRPHISRETVGRMNESLLAAINQMVPRNGILAIVGDFCWPHTNNEAEYFNIVKRYRSAIHCQNLHMIWGNHDPRCIASLFKWVNEKATVLVDDHYVVLDHEAHYFWDRRHHYSRHYYGHTHGSGEVELDHVMIDRFSQDVGIDNAYRLTGQRRPFSDIELEEIMKKRSGFGVFKENKELDE